MNESDARSKGGTLSSSIPRSFGAFAVTLAAYAGVVSTAHAQTGDSVIQGKVIAADTKAPLPEVIVTLRSAAVQGDQTVLTDASGFYRAPNLPPGQYIVRFDKDGHSSFERGQIVLRSSSTLRVDGALVPENVKGEEIYLTEAPPTVDIGSSSVSTTISSEMSRRVPITRPGGVKGSSVRSFESVAQAAPEAKEDDYGTSVAGTTSPENRYIIDGLSVNNPAFGLGSTPLSAEFVQEVNIVTGGYMPEYGRLTGGVLNVVTKTGSNAFTAGAWSNLTPGALEGKRDRFPREGTTISYEQPKIGWITDTGGEVGGRIIRDKLWFYLGYDYSRLNYDIERNLYQTQLDAAGVPVVDPATNRTQVDQIPGSRTQNNAVGSGHQAIGKLTFAPSKNHSFSLTAIYARTGSGNETSFGINPQDGDPDPLVTAAGSFSALARRYQNNALDSILKWTAATSTRRFVVDTTLGWHSETYKEQPATAALRDLPLSQYRQTTPAPHAIGFFPGEGSLVGPGFCADKAEVRCPVRAYSLGGPGILYDSGLERYQLRSVVTMVANLLGHHVAKAGVDLELVTYDHGSAYSGLTAFREGEDGTTFTDIRNFGYLAGPDDARFLNEFRTNTKAYTLGGFLQNSWSVMDKVTVNLGLRYDAQYIFDTYGNGALGLPNQWSPRMGFIYDPTQAGRARIFGSYSRYYQNVPLDMAHRALSGEPSIRLTARTAMVCDPRDPGMARGACQDPANLTTVTGAANPNTKYALSAGTTPVDPDLKPSSSDEIVVGAEMEVVASRLGLTYTRRQLNNAVEDMSRDEGFTYFIGNPGKGIAKDFPLAIRDYDALSLYFSRSLAGGWLAQASYTLSWLRGNYAGLFRPETGQLNPNINSDFDIQSILPNREGDLPGDRRHQAKAFAAKDWAFSPEHSLLTGLGGRVTSGSPTNYLGSHPDYGPGEVYVLPRGSGQRTDWTYSLDLRVGYAFAFAKAYRLSATVDVYNLLNFQKVTSRDQEYTRSDILPVPLPPGQAANTTAIEKYGTTPEGERFDVEANRNKNHGRPTRSQEPRIFQFGLRATF